jgi:hypothetical protein
MLPRPFHSRIAQLGEILQGIVHPSISTAIALHSYSN